MNKGLRAARQLLVDVTTLAYLQQTEYLDLISPQYVSDLDCLGSNWRQKRLKARAP